MSNNVVSFDFQKIPLQASYDACSRFVEETISRYSGKDLKPLADIKAKEAQAKKLTKLNEIDDYKLKFRIYQFYFPRHRTLLETNLKDRKKKVEKLTQDIKMDLQKLAFDDCNVNIFSRLFRLNGGTKITLHLKQPTEKSCSIEIMFAILQIADL